MEDTELSDLVSQEDEQAKDPFSELDLSDIQPQQVYLLINLSGALFLPWLLTDFTTIVMLKCFEHVY